MLQGMVLWVLLGPSPWASETSGRTIKCWLWWGQVWAWSTWDGTSWNQTRWTESKRTLCLSRVSSPTSHLRRLLPLPRASEPSRCAAGKPAGSNLWACWPAWVSPQSDFKELFCSVVMQDEASELAQEELAVGGRRGVCHHPPEHVADAESHEECGTIRGSAQTQRFRENGMTCSEARAACLCPRTINLWPGLITMYVVSHVFWWWFINKPLYFWFINKVIYVLWFGFSVTAHLNLIFLFLFFSSYWGAKDPEIKMTFRRGRTSEKNPAYLWSITLMLKSPELSMLPVKTYQVDITDLRYYLLLFECFSVQFRWFLVNKYLCLSRQTLNSRHNKLSNIISLLN